MRSREEETLTSNTSSQPFSAHLHPAHVISKHGSRSNLSRLRGTRFQLRFSGMEHATVPNTSLIDVCGCAPTLPLRPAMLCIQASVCTSSLRLAIARICNGCSWSATEAGGLSPGPRLQLGIPFPLALSLSVHLRRACGVVISTTQRQLTIGVRCCLYATYKKAVRIPNRSSLTFSSSTLQIKHPRSFTLTITLQLYNEVRHCPLSSGSSR